MNKRNIMYISISIICVISIILGVYYQMFADKVVDEKTPVSLTVNKLEREIVLIC